MSAQLIYVAGPYSAATAAGVAENVSRAWRVGRLAISQGHVPIVPHLFGIGGLYGDPMDDGGPAGGASRAVALRNGIELARMVSRAGGRLWVIARDDRSLSPGTQLELDAFTCANDAVTRKIIVRAWIKSQRIIVRTWAEWEPA